VRIEHANLSRCVSNIQLVTMRFELTICHGTYRNYNLSRSASKCHFVTGYRTDHLSR